jgi:hypothetical protein
MNVLKQRIFLKWSDGDNGTLHELDGSRRDITHDEYKQLWTPGDVMIVIDRPEPVYLQPVIAAEKPQQPEPQQPAPQVVQLQISVDGPRLKRSKDVVERDTQGLIDGKSTVYEYVD